MAFEIGDIVKILKGTWKDKSGKVEVITDSAPKGIGVSIAGSKVALIWFEPNEIQKEE